MGRSSRGPLTRDPAAAEHPAVTLDRVRQARPHLWYDVAWPVVAGAATGTGLLAAYRWTGPLIFGIALVALEATIAPLAWTVMTELGHDTRGVVLRRAPSVAVGALAMVGLADALGSWCFVVGAFVLMTSPLVRGWTRGALQDSLAGRVSPRAETRRRFDEIVAGFGPLDDDPSSF